MPTPEENMQFVRSFAEEVSAARISSTRPTGLPMTSSNIKCFQEPRPTRRVQLIRIASSSRDRLTLRPRSTTWSRPATRLRSEPRTGAPTKADSSPTCRLPETLRNGGHLRRPDQPPGTNRRHHRNNGTAGPASAPRMSGRCPGDSVDTLHGPIRFQHARHLSFKPLRRIGDLTPQLFETSNLLSSRRSRLTA